VERGVGEALTRNVEYTGRAHTCMSDEIRELGRLLRKHAWDASVEGHAQEADERGLW
jgi:hypothetical protein